MDEFFRNIGGLDALLIRVGVTALAFLVYYLIDKATKPAATETAPESPHSD